MGQRPGWIFVRAGFKPACTAGCLAEGDGSTTRMADLLSIIEFVTEGNDKLPNVAGWGIIARVVSAAWVGRGIHKEIEKRCRWNRGFFLTFKSSNVSCTNMPM